MLHGFGATNRDFVFLAEALASSQPLTGKRLMAVLPQASGFPPQWYCDRESSPIGSIHEWNPDPI
jgi:hypothetical protein